MAEEVGIIFGEVSHRDFNFLLGEDSEVSKSSYVKINHENYGWVLSQITSIRISNELYSFSAIKREREVKDSERRIATAKIIGYLDEKGVLTTPKIPFKPGTEGLFCRQQTNKEVPGT